MPAKTLDLLDWPRLTQHLSTFAMTKLGSLVTQQLTPAQSLRESQRLLQQTQEVVELESRTGSLSFDGVQDISAALERAGRRGILSGMELLSIATTLSAARQLRRIVDRFPELVSINDLMSGLRTFPELEQEIHHCIDDQGDVEDRASEKIAEIRDHGRHSRQQVQKNSAKHFAAQGECPSGDFDYPAL
jgi:DNA mismatch repair protein MutS2